MGFSHRCLLLNCNLSALRRGKDGAGCDTRWFNVMIATDESISLGENEEALLSLPYSASVATDSKDEEIRIPKRTFLGRYRTLSAVKHQS